nr:MAG TPA: hypothetical protein [Caudoviricetes sp.]
MGWTNSSPRSICGGCGIVYSGSSRNGSYKS